MNNFYCGLTKKRRDHYIDQFESTPPQNAFTQGSSFLTNFSFLNQQTGIPFDPIMFCAKLVKIGSVVLMKK